MVIAEAPTEEPLIETPEESNCRGYSSIAAGDQTKGNHLTYTLQEIEEPVMSESLVADNQQKEKSFKKVIDFARTVKNSDSPIGNLRSMKEELFALELKKKNSSKKH